MTEYRFSPRHAEQSIGERIPQAPDFIRARQVFVKDILPGQIAFVSHNSVAMDEATGQLCIDTKDRLSQTANFLTRARGSVGALRIYKEVKGTLLDGFIVDLRSVTFIEPRNLGLEGGLGSEKFCEAIEQWGTQPLLAAVFADETGQLIFTGDQRLQDDAAALLAAVDSNGPRKPLTVLDVAVITEN
jgi:hypothetical protein